MLIFALTFIPTFIKMFNTANFVNNTEFSDVIVYKLGGTSQSLEGYENLKKIIYEQSSKAIVILSAVSGVTNELIKFTETKEIEWINNVINKNRILYDEIFSQFFEMIKNNITLLNVITHIKTLYEAIEDQLYELVKNYKKKSYSNDDLYDKFRIIGFGEVMSTNIFALYCAVIDHIENSLNPNTDFNLSSQLLNSYEYIHSKKEIYQYDSCGEFIAIPIDFDKYPNKNIFILQGFIGSTPSGKPVLLGRGGSDTTGSLVSKANNAKHYEIWSDIDGIYTGDLRVFPNAKITKQIDYMLCQELSALGAKVIHPLSIKPCADSKIPIYIRDIFSQNIETRICDVENQEEMFHAIQTSQTIFKIKSFDMWNSHGFITNIFRKFSESRINIDIISTSQFSISTTTSESNILKLMEIRDKLKENFSVEMISDCVILSFVKKNIKNVISQFDFSKFDSELIHISDNNTTINVVLKNYDPKILDLIYLHA